MLKKVPLSLLAVGVIAIIVMAVYFFLAMRGPDLAKYQYLKDPQITQKPNQKMLVVEAKGDPNTVGAKAFALLFRAYFKTVKGGKMQIPQARWPQDLGTSTDQWLGQYGLPLPESVNKLPEIKTDPEFKLYITEWEYGMVAEILHIGPYSKEAPTIERLKKHAHDNGYYITGLHEEEYLKGPGMFGPGDPKKYHTIIRYRVEKTAVEDTKETKKK